MWIKLLALGLAINLEPTRITLLPLLLTRNRPLLQLSAFVAFNLMTSLGFGVLILFVLQHSLVGADASNNSWTQAAVGLLALAVAAIIAVRWMWMQRLKALGAATHTPYRVGHAINRLKQVLARSHSPWIAAVVGVISALPSIDYLAVVAIIGSSGAPALQQLALLLMFILAGSLVVLTPLICFLIAPAGTGAAIDRAATWLQERSQLTYAALLAVIGTLLLAFPQH